MGDTTNILRITNYGRSFVFLMSCRWRLLCRAQNLDAVIHLPIDLDIGDDYKFDQKIFTLSFSLLCQAILNIFKKCVL